MLLKSKYRCILCTIELYSLTQPTVITEGDKEKGNEIHSCYSDIGSEFEKTYLRSTGVPTHYQHKQTMMKKKIGRKTVPTM